MKNFRVTLDISKVFSNIKHLHLRGYKSPFPTIFLSASDPDDACLIAINSLIKLLLDQDPSIHMRVICRRIRLTSRIDKVELL